MGAALLLLAVNYTVHLCVDKVFLLTGRAGQKIHVACPFAQIETRPAPLSFVVFYLLTQIYYFCTENLNAANYSANLRLVESAEERGIV